MHGARPSAGDDGTGSAAVGADHRPETITALTGIRALAALAVVVFHFRAPLYALLPATHAADPWLSFGYLGVDVFFVLSGFIISHNYAARLAAPDRRQCRTYVLARFARIYPVHLVTLLLSAALIAYFAATGAPVDAQQKHTALGFVGNLLMLQGLPHVDAWNGPSWSISCEAVAYVAFPFVAAVLMRLDRRRALLLAAAVACCQIVVLETIGWGHGTFAVNWVRIAGEFTLGCLLWAAWRHGVRRHWLWDVVALGAVVVTLALFAVGRGWLAVPFLALLVVSTANATGVVRAVLASRPLEWGGRTSFSMYMVHIPVIAVVFGVLPPTDFAAASLVVRLAVVGAYFVAMVVVAAVLYYAVEEPARHWIRRRTAVRQRPMAGEVSQPTQPTAV